MARPERPIDPSWPLADFASGLRALRDKCKITYREMASLAYCSAGSLSEAASGRKLPSWQVTKGYVTACGGSLNEWKGRWDEASDLTRARGTGRPDG
jgi:transcriptional regulator with XRE-family HTH domain